MHAAVFAAPNKIRMERVRIPEPGEGEVRVRIEGCGVCGSNLVPWEGRPWFRYPLSPGEPGHEAWGEVDALGDKVSRFAIGDRVAMLSYRAFAEWDLAKEDAVVRLPPALQSKPFPGEALGCAMNVFRRCQISKDQTVAVIGIGFLGALLTSLISQMGARVIAISRRSFALDMARMLGAQETISLEDHSRIIEKVQKITNGSGCSCVIEAVGLQQPLDLAGVLARERGRLVIAGYHQDGVRQVNMQLWNWRGLDVINAHERDPKVYLEGMEAAIKAVACGDLNPSPLYTHCFALDGISDAMQALRNRPDKFLKAWIKL